jgi:hypothetical protein
LGKTEEWEGTYGVVAGAEHGAIACNCDRSYGNIILGDELVRALVLPQVPNPHCASPITADQLALIRMYDHIVDSAAMVVIPLHTSTPSIPDLDSAVFGRCNHPFALTVESYACDVAGVTVECEDGGWIGGFDVVELDGVVASSCEVTFIGGDAQAVDLGVWVGNCAGTYS